MVEFSYNDPLMQTLLPRSSLIKRRGTPVIRRHCLFKSKFNRRKGGREFSAVPEQMCMTPSEASPQKTRCKAVESSRGLPHSKALTRSPEPSKRRSFWTAIVSAAFAPVQFNVPIQNEKNLCLAPSWSDCHKKFAEHLGGVRESSKNV